MDAKIAISNVRDALTELRKSGQEFVSIDALFDYLSSLESAAPDSVEFKRLQQDSALAQHRAAHEANLEMFKSVLEAGRTALTACILVNGGATVALLAYLGKHISNNLGAEPTEWLVRGLVTFATAVLLGASATGVRYLSQASYSQNWNRTGVAFTVASTLLVVGAYVLFGFGIHTATQAFS